MPLLFRLDRTTDLFLKIIGLRHVHVGSRLTDPYDIFQTHATEPADRRALRSAALFAVLLHLLLFLVRFAGISQVFVPDIRDFVPLRALAAPPGRVDSGQPRSSAPRSLETAKPKPQFLPFPDPTPDEPEPLYEATAEPAPEIMLLEGMGLEIGAPAAPPGGGGSEGLSQGSRNRSGHERSDVYQPGNGVRAPVLLAQPLPLYTEEAHKARIEGIVLIQAIVRKDGTVDSFRVLRGLGYGLDESAIRTISTKWRFRPGTLNGEPVDVMATFEVSFRLF